MKAMEYRDMTVEELRAREKELRQTLLNLRIRSTTKELENTSRMKQEKKELARVLTVIQEKETAAAQA